MSHSELAIAGFYDHEQKHRRRAPDWGGDDLFAAAPRRRFERATAEAPAPPPAAPDPTPDASEIRHEHRAMTPVPAGRRTVTITGRPESLAVTRRPARSLDERIAHRPERIASWTCAMGFLLIALAVLTAH